MHSEICPICQGKGTKPSELWVSTGGNPESMVTEPCHGCDGKGWIIIPDGPDMEALIKLGMKPSGFEHKGGQKEKRKKY